MATKKQEVLSTTVDQAVVLGQVKTIEKDVKAIQKRIAAVEKIEDEEDYATACGVLLEIVEKRKYVEEQREGFMEDVRKLVERVESWFKPALADIDKAETFFRDALEAYAVTLAAKAKGLRATAARLPERDWARVQELRDEADALVPPKFPGISITTKVKLVIDDEKKIPDKYTKRVPDAKLIQAELERGVDIAGCRLEEDKSVRVTPKHAK